MKVCKIVIFRLKYNFTLQKYTFKIIKNTFFISIFLLNESKNIII